MTTQNTPAARHLETQRISALPTLGLLFGLEGRLGRGAWWALSLLAVLLMLALPMAQAGGFPPSGVNQKLLALVAFLAIWMFFAAAAKRLHDLDKHRYWAAPLVFVLFSLIGAAAPLRIFSILPHWFNNGPEGSHQLLLFVLAGAAYLYIMLGAAALWMLYELGLRPGTPGENRYGPAPGPQSGLKQPEAG